MRLISRRSFVGGAAGVSAAALLPALAGAKGLPKRARGWALHGYMRDLHRWHCQTFFDLDAGLGAPGRRFVDACIDQMEARAEKINDDFFYSTMAYSHRVKGAQVNSARVACGSLRNKRALRPLIVENLRARGVAARDVPNLDDAFGLGWDFEANHFKVYFHLQDLVRLEDPKVKALRARVGGAKTYDFGLASYTFQGGRQIERKMYLAMRDPRPELVRALPFADLVAHTNYMVTDHRGVVPQVDVRSGTFDGKHLNRKGREICDAYLRQVGRKLTHEDARVDTLAYQSRDEFTLYF